MKNKKIAISVITFALVLTGLVTFAGNKALANGYMGGSNNDEMTQKLSEKLNISQDQVTTAMDQIREDRQAEHKTEISANLDKAVTDGVITAEQKQALLDKQTELEKQREAERTAMEKWKTDSGIDFSKLEKYDVGMGMGNGMGGGRHRGMDF